MLAWANDRYVITAGDAAATTYVGRAWNAAERTWQTVTDGSMRGSILPRKRLMLRCFDLRVLTSISAIKTGVRIMFMILPDPLHTDSVMVVADDVQSALKTFNWFGEQEIGAGFQWRIHLNALVAGDIVTLSAGYEEHL